MSTIVFDFDGTIADSFPLVVDITYQITRAHRLHPEKIEALRQVPMLEAVRKLGGTTWDIPFLVLLTRRRMQPRMNEVHAFPGIVTALQQLHEAGHRLFILTSNREQNARAFLQHHGLASYFQDVAHCNVFLKGSGLKKLLREHELSARNCYYIGNEAADVDTAQSAGAHGIGVSWSGTDRAKLASAQPFALVDHPEELVTLFTEQV